MPWTPQTDPPMFLAQSRPWRSSSMTELVMLQDRTHGTISVVLMMSQQSAHLFHCQLSLRRISRWGGPAVHGLPTLLHFLPRCSSSSSSNDSRSGRQDTYWLQTPYQPPHHPQQTHLGLLISVIVTNMLKLNMDMMTAATAAQANLLQNSKLLGGCQAWWQEHMLTHLALPIKAT